MVLEDVPSPIDLRLMSDAQEWERTAMQRPFRLDFFEAFAKELRALTATPMHILELGSGPGFLADYLLSSMPELQMTLLDFSAAMHDLARERIAGYIDRVTFIERNFKEPNWTDNLGKFDAVVTNQAVHELRHKRYAKKLHEQVKPLLMEGGIYLVCDHFCGEGGMQNDQLYMSLAEHCECLEQSGYAVKEVLIKGGRVLYRAT